MDGDEPLQALDRKVHDADSKGVVQDCGPVHRVREPLAEQMGHLHDRIHHAIEAEEPQTKGQFRVLAAPHDESAVEPPDLFEGLTADREECPWEQRDRIWLLGPAAEPGHAEVRAVPGEPVAARVGPAQHAHRARDRARPSFSKGGRKSCRPTGTRLDVCVGEDEDLAPSRRCAPIPCRDSTDPLGRADEPHACVAPAEQIGAAIGRGIVNDDDLGIWRQRPEQMVDGGAQLIAFVV